MTLEEIKKQEEMYVMHTYNRFPMLWNAEREQYSGTARDAPI